MKKEQVDKEVKVTYDCEAMAHFPEQLPSHESWLWWDWTQDDLSHWSYLTSVIHWKSSVDLTNSQHSQKNQVPETPLVQDRYHGYKHGHPILKKKKKERGKKGNIYFLFFASPDHTRISLALSWATRNTIARVSKQESKSRPSPGFKSYTVSPFHPILAGTPPRRLEPRVDYEHDLQSLRRVSWMSKKRNGP